jgi:PEP-CTERM motif
MKQTTKLASVACVAGALAFTVLSAQAQNLLVDPSFEAAAFGQPNPIPIPAGVGGGWAAFGGTLTTAAAHAGLQSAALADNSWNPSGVYQVLSITPGDTYAASAWFENTGAASSYTTPYIINVQFTDAAGNNIGAAASTGWTSEGTLNVWHQLSVNALAPTGASLAEVYLMAMNGAQLTGTGYKVDDASLAVVPEPCTLTLVGLGLAGALIWRRR